MATQIPLEFRIADENKGPEQLELSLPENKGYYPFSKAEREAEKYMVGEENWMRIPWKNTRKEYINWITDYCEDQGKELPKNLKSMKLKQLQGTYAGMYKAMELDRIKKKTTLDILLSSNKEYELRDKLALMNRLDLTQLYEDMREKYQ